MVCTACPVECGVDRARKPGACRATETIEVSQAQLHFWEEPPISGSRGSGTIFFSHCNLHCRFCQNYDISQLGFGRPVTPQRLGEIMLELRDKGAHNLNLVSPTHYTNQVVPVLEAVGPKLGIPVVWNSNGYEKAETLSRLQGLVQVFLPDIKYFSDDLAIACSSAPDYFRFASAAVLEMLRQVGPNRYDSQGLLEQGMIIRHLVLPGHGDDSKRILSWIRSTLGAAVHVSLMSQYYPTHRAAELPGLDRRLDPAEYEEIRQHYIGLEFEEGFAQELDSATRDYTPEFKGHGV
jgi:putative pyruvate formate lyase activating enzyme